ncbi:MAG: serine hydrolase domain-containing protein [Planctomycetota bacterium]
MIALLLLLAAEFDQAIEKDFWGAVLVAHKGEVVYAKGFGMADYESKPIATDSLFEIASISKQFTAAAVLKLQMQGKLDVHDPIARYFKDVPEDKQGITIHHLLTHTSGLSNKAILPYASRHTRDRFLKHAFSFPLESEPGEKFAYSNPGYAMLAALVEVVSMKSFEEYSREYLFKPAELNDTGFIRDKQLDRKRMTTRMAHNGAKATAADWFWGWGYRGMGGVVSTVEDMERWDRALKGEQVLDAKTKAIYYEPNLSSYACGWRTTTSPRGTKRIEHSGGVAGYAANYVRLPEEDAVIVVLSNGRTNIHAITARLEQALLPSPKITVDIDVTPHELTKFNAVIFDGTAKWKVTKGDTVDLALLDPEGHAVLTIHLPAGRAKALRNELDARLKNRKAVKTKAGMEAGVYLVAHRDRGKKFKLDGDLAISLMPRYRGRGPQGPIVDERPTLIIMDRKRRSWPLMAKMDEPAARDLLKQLLQVQ